MCDRFHSLIRNRIMMTYKNNTEIYADVLSKLKVFSSTEELAKWIDALKLPLGKRTPKIVLECLEIYLNKTIPVRIRQIAKEYEIVANTDNVQPDQWETYGLSAATLGTIAAAGLGSFSVLWFGLLAPGAAFAVSLISILSGFWGGGFFWSSSLAKKIYPKYVEQNEKLAQQITDAIVAHNCKIKQQKQLSHGVRGMQSDDNNNIFNSSGACLTQNQQRIKSFLDERGIKYLVHFTDQRNIPSIRQHGLLPVSMLEERTICYVHNDDGRNDNYRNGISLSISAENEFVRSSFENEYPDRVYKRIAIDASVLYLETTSRIYCQTNAATVSGHKGSDVEDLMAMFANQVCYTLRNSNEPRILNRMGRASNQPTDVQAEILWLGNIPTKYLHFI